MSTTTTKDSWEIKLLRTMVWIYIVLCILIAGFNYGYAPSAPESVRQFINSFWLFYENWIKTFLIVGCGYLTLRIVGKRQRTTMRRRNIIGMTIAALFIHILIPLASGNQEIYFYGMPLPWSNVPLQSMVPSADFTQRHMLLWGAQGITFALTIFWIINVIVLIGTLIFGRRWQCSTLCLFNGFAAEVFSPALPLLTKRRATRTQGSLRVTKKEARRFSVIRILFFIISISLTIFWLLQIWGVPDRKLMGIFERVELYKYLVFELIMMVLLGCIHRKGVLSLLPGGNRCRLVGQSGGTKDRNQHDELYRLPTLFQGVSCRDRCGRVCTKGCAYGQHEVCGMWTLCRCMSHRNTALHHQYNGIVRTNEEKNLRTVVTAVSCYPNRAPQSQSR